MIEHSLSTSLVGDVTVMVPDEWPAEYGFILRVGSLAADPLVRVQSRCAYGEVFGSRHCDCRGQLEASAAVIREEGGLIVYLEQEGRGAGITAKAAAYRAAERDLIDTFSHYESSGLPADPRHYEEVAVVLRSLGVRRMRLLTNNPQKLEALSTAGLTVTRVPLVVGVDAKAARYISAKRARGHLL